VLPSLIKDQIGEVAVFVKQDLIDASIRALSGLYVDFNVTDGIEIPLHGIVDVYYCIDVKPSEKFEGFIQTFLECYSDGDYRVPSDSDLQYVKEKALRMGHLARYNHFFGKKYKAYVGTFFSHMYYNREEAMAAAIMQAGVYDVVVDDHGFDLTEPNKSSVPTPVQTVPGNSGAECVE